MDTSEELTGPYHDFWILDKKTNSTEDFLDFSGRKDAPVRLEDDLILYLNDTLKWVPTQSVTGDKLKGLHFYSITIIMDDGAVFLRNLIKNWLGIFKLAPDNFTLTGSYGFQLNDEALPVDEGSYTKHMIHKSILISKLEKLLEMAEVASEGQHFILHLGI